MHPGRCELRAVPSPPRRRAAAGQGLLPRCPRPPRPPLRSAPAGRGTRSSRSAARGCGYRRSLRTARSRRPGSAEVGPGVRSRDRGAGMGAAPLPECICAARTAPAASPQPRSAQSGLGAVRAAPPRPALPCPAAAPARPRGPRPPPLSLPPLPSLPARGAASAAQPHAPRGAVRRARLDCCSCGIPCQTDVIPSLFFFVGAGRGGRCGVRGALSAGPAAELCVRDRRADPAALRCGAAVRARPSPAAAGAAVPAVSGTMRGLGSVVSGLALAVRWVQA